LLRRRRILGPVCLFGLACGLALLASRPEAVLAQTKPENDLDAFMAKVLQRRADTWRQLGDYILDETEQFAIHGPGDVRLFGQQRQYSWYVREGYLIRSPVKFNGVTLSDADRRKYETDWFSQEQHRALKQLDLRSEPRFISESYFLKFKFEPGNYYLVAHEQLENREVLRIEYYPRTQLWAGIDDDEEDKGKKESKDPKRAKDARDAKEVEREKTMEQDLERKFNKVALVTLWIEPQEQQIVKYTFDNVDFGFLPGRWIARADQLSASMSTSQPFPGVWLPRDMTVEGGFTLAAGSYRVRYNREFHDYKQSDVRAKIRGYEREP
jgi:hypothetical protein